ncbi:hypothetical protein K450DRAFT_236059 [Umbelopsis ramanniana AG]|uniref:ribonuclease T2 n=1 Tax=Umbelopsis ramanniana AG TaxID=1314678 RepID=A0AAD5HE19_UMBRA|nr:uncharacterized protein K450DRAFT_236059 [Umbelopsis ramanniana AG]KAI8580802.1 hypothetical protein K450DRAFT_236059 [Umbelopsis ramanniana AG]
MKLYIPSFLLALTLTVAAEPLQQVPILSPRQSCNDSVVSCHWREPENTCCSPRYGLVVFVQQWVESYGPPNEFTIHGLWPNNCSGSRAPNRGCDSSRSWNNVATILRNKNPNLYQRMKTFWPSYKGDDNWFWSHEWVKHGTCVSTLNPSCYGSEYTPYQDVIDYFEQVLFLRNEYDVYGALNVAGIFPGGYYSSKAMLDALKQGFGNRAKIDCDRNGQLSEVWLYFNVGGRDHYQLVDAEMDGSCRGRVYYPKK